MGCGPAKEMMETGDVELEPGSKVWRDGIALSAGSGVVVWMEPEGISLAERTECCRIYNKAQQVRHSWKRRSGGKTEVGNGGGRTKPDIIGGPQHAINTKEFN